jgi:hypothetical protein
VQTGLRYTAFVDGHDLARIRYVTRHFHNLQGLSFAALCVPVLAWLWFFAYLDDDRAVRSFQAMGLCLAAGFYSLWVSHRVREYYGARFGMLRDAYQLERGLPWVLLFLAAGLADLLRLAGGGPSAVLLMATLLGLWRAARGWPWRAHQLLLAAIAAYGLFVLPLPGGGVNPEIYIRLVLMILFTTAGLCALLDHWLLVRTLAPRRHGVDDDVQAPEGIEP